jgi:hypothetical protein
MSITGNLAPTWPRPCRKAAAAALLRGDGETGIPVVQAGRLKIERCRCSFDYIDIAR